MQAISTPHPQISNTLLLVVPRDFSFNEETALDNEFQSNPSLEKAKLLEAVLKEFYDSVKILRDAGITVLDIDKNDDISLLVDKTPDSIFPNNWLSTSSDGRIYVYHMFAANRRLETKLLPLVEKTLKNNGFKYNEVIEIKGDSDEFLEGTGSMIFNKVNRSIYAAISLRTNEKILKKYAEITGENIISFHTKSSKNMPFYHTNIMLCIGEGFAVICSESISDETERKNVLENLKASSLEIIEISLEQAEKSFCGNMLHVRSFKDPTTRYIVLSQRAFLGLTEAQKTSLQKYGNLLPLPIRLIEDIGGGSARCMLCEIFLKKI